MKRTLLKGTGAGYRDAGPRARRAAPAPGRPRRQAARPGGAGAGAGCSRSSSSRDVHILDAQSPLRVEFTDRQDDDPQASSGIFTSAYRPHEMLTAQIADAMVRRINRIQRGPVTGKRLALAIQTGDNSDNSQLNEIRWNIDVLDGRPVRVDSGDLTTYEGVADDDPTYYDTHYWHPHGTPPGKQDDIPRRVRGFPTVPGPARRRPPAVPGGRPRDAVVHRARQPRRSRAGQLPDQDAPAQRRRDRRAEADVDARGALAGGPDRRDDQRQPPGAAAVAGRHAGGAPGHRRPPAPAAGPQPSWSPSTSRPPGRRAGTGSRAATAPTGRRTTPSTRGGSGSSSWTPSTPTATPTGRSTRPSSPGSGDLLDRVGGPGRHRLQPPHLGDDGQPAGRRPAATRSRRVLGPEVLALLLAHPCVVAWVNGHSHQNRIWARPRPGGGGLWEINTAAHIDWPLQSRIIEVADNRDGTLSLFTTVVDHAGTRRLERPPRHHAAAGLARPRARRQRLAPPRRLGPRRAQGPQRRAGGRRP